MYTCACKGPRREERRTLGEDEVDVDECANEDEGRGHVDGALLAVVVPEDEGAAGAENHLVGFLGVGGRLGLGGRLVTFLVVAVHAMMDVDVDSRGRAHTNVHMDTHRSSEGREHGGDEPREDDGQDACGEGGGSYMHAAAWAWSISDVLYFHIRTTHRCGRTAVGREEALVVGHPVDRPGALVRPGEADDSAFFFGGGGDVLCMFVSVGCECVVTWMDGVDDANEDGSRPIDRCH